MLETVRLQLTDVVYRRARHAVSEDRRTLATVQALQEKDYTAVGKDDWNALASKLFVLFIHIHRNC